MPENEAAEQINLFEAEASPRRQRREQLERAMDGIRQKYGDEAIISAIVMKEDIDQPGDHAGSIPPPGGG